MYTKFTPTETAAGPRPVLAIRFVLDASIIEAARKSPATSSFDSITTFCSISVIATATPKSSAIGTAATTVSVTTEILTLPSTPVPVATIRLSLVATTFTRATTREVAATRAKDSATSMPMRSLFSAVVKPRTGNLPTRISMSMLRACISASPPAGPVPPILMSTFKF